MKTNRRQARTVPANLAFIQLDGDDGGRVLNVSEEGLGFEALAPLPQNGPIRFWFSLDLSDRIETVGKLVWASGKTGGLKFLELSPSARDQIRNWIRQNSEQNVLAAENSSPEVIETQTSTATQLVPLEQYRSAARRQLIRGLFLGILLTSAVAIPAAKYSNNHKQDAASQPASGQTALANSEPQTVIAAPLSVNDASRNSVTSAAGKTQQSAPRGRLPDNPPGLGLVKHRSQPLDPSVENGSMLSVAQLQSSETRGAKKSVALPQQLWSAVQGGNTQAAVTLADHYLHGNGVPANCDQARVLLLVASKKRNAQAIKELKELDKTGCPVAAQ
jgi:PilZ domain-containing protein